MTPRRLMLIGAATVNAVCYASAHASIANEPERLYGRREDLAAGHARTRTRRRSGRGCDPAWARSPRGHFWLRPWGRLPNRPGIVQGLKYRGRIKQELERSIAIDPRWQGGSAEAALGQWYAEVPRWLDGSPTNAEDHLRRALVYDADNRIALSVLTDLLVATGRRGEARALLRGARCAD
jgi:hypothetical protein